MSPADYRLYSAELLRIAERVGDHQSKAAMIAMAQSWQHLAAQAEKNLQTVLVYETSEPRRRQVAQQQQQPQADPEKQANPEK
jgi:hypothetical protein